MPDNKDADVLAGLVGGGDRHGQQHFDGRVAFVEEVGDQTGIAVKGTITGFAQKAAAMGDTPSTSFSTKKSFGATLDSLALRSRLALDVEVELRVGADDLASHQYVID